ncbi:hypothetical protein [Apilactobacillus timberlakei]|uniref:hypothetical protein n=1 Tax=Apilactobacillus timberlakei TaxID=2008380 RepID=UPI0011278C63|nr:hypothetical protein [Apilactobacillus timberlakei]TPR19068.1 hypothetical protein DYZ95_00175 [Apilactobacillus timberlakei]
MQLKLKKSIYLGLAALTFASVAGATTASATTANAASKHHAEKVTKKSHKKVTKKHAVKKHAKKAAKKAPVTFNVTKSLNQGIVYKATGSNAIYTKPNGVKGSQISVTKDNMASKANSNSADDLFMAYQQVKTSKGVHYYKVVSFDKKVRGYVYTKGIAQVNPVSAATTPSNTTGYVTTNNISNYPYGSKFGSKVQNFNGIDFSKDKFTVSEAMTVGNDTYYKVADQSNSLINGWVNANDFTNNTPKAITDAQNYANGVHVTYVNNNTYQTISNETLNPANLKNDGTYATQDIINAINNSLYGKGYANVTNDKVNDNSQNSQNLNTTTVVKKGDNLTVLVTPQTQLNYGIYGVNNKGAFNQSTTSVNTTELNPITIANTDRNNLFLGDANGNFNYTNFSNNALASGKYMNTLTSKDGKYTYKFDAAMTENNSANPALFSGNGISTIKPNVKLSDLNAQNNGKGLNLVYDITENSTGKTVNASDVNIFG